MRHAALKADHVLTLSARGRAARRRRTGVQDGADPACRDPAHLALFYVSDTEYVEQVMAFLSPGLRAGDPVAVAVPHERTPLLTEHLGPSGPDLEILDMCSLGRNPARIIPAMLTMLERHRGRTLHYVGEPVWPGRSPAEVQEATRHEALINLAWPDAPIRALCPYDAVRLESPVLRDAEMTHPWVMRNGRTALSRAYTGSSFPQGTDDALPDPPAHAAGTSFGVRDLGAVRELVAEQATAAGLGSEKAHDFIIAVNEVASNAIKYAGRQGRLRLWSTGAELICQLEDPGHIVDPLAGRHRPAPGVTGGVGLWMVHQLCDLVEVRTARAGTTIRLHAALG